MKRTTIIEAIVFLYALLFLYTGVSKLMDYKEFSEQLEDIPILTPIAPFLAVVLPCAEFCVVALMVIPRWRRLGLWAAFTTMACFTIYIISLLSFSDKLPCSCGGVISQLSWPQHIILNSSFMILAILAIVLQMKEVKYGDKKWNFKGPPKREILTRG